LAVGGGTGGGVAVARYQPLVIGSMEEAPSGQQIDLDSFSGPTEAYQYAYHDGGVITIGPGVVNTGHFAVRITGVDTPHGQHTLLRPVSIRTNIPGRELSYDDDGTMPFQPFDLAPGDDRVLLIHLRMSDCEFFAPGGVESFDAIVVHFSFLGIDHRAEVPLNQPVQVAAPAAAADCPRPSQFSPR
jgi:hypothetical protein